MKKIKILSVLLALLLLMLQLAACNSTKDDENNNDTPTPGISPEGSTPSDDSNSPEEETSPEGTDFYFSALSDGTYAVYIDASSTATKLTLPTTYEDKKVTKFGGFLGQKIYLTDLTVPAEIKVIDYKFNSLHDWENVNVHVSNLSHWFEADVDLPSDINLYVGDEKIVGQLVVPEGITVIKQGTVIPKNIVSITLPSTITRIDAGKFYSIREVINYSSLNIKVGAQSNGGIAKDALYVHNEQTSKLEFIDGFVFAEDKAIAYVGESTDLVFPEHDEKTYIVDEVFFSTIQDVTSIVFSDSVLKIGSFAFAYCESLTSVTISSSITEIGKGAFEGCESLEEVIFMDTDGWCYNALLTENHEQAFEPEAIMNLDDKIISAMNLKYILCNETWFKIQPEQQ